MVIVCEVLLNYEPKLFKPVLELVKGDRIKEAMVVTMSVCQSVYQVWEVLLNLASILI